MRRFATFFCVLAAIALLAGIFVISVQMVVMNRDFFTLEYQKMDTARKLGVTQSALDEVTDQLLSYLEGEDVDLSDIRVRVNGERQRIFSSNEVQHMVDVRDLYQGALTVRNVTLLFAALVLLLTLLGVRRERARLYARAYVTGLSIVGAIFLVLGIWAMVDFDSFWTAFHLLFFRNMLWQMDVSSSFMINMFPGQFWYDVCMRVLLYLGVAAGVLLLLSVVVLLLQKQRRSNLMYLEESDVDSEYDGYGKPKDRGEGAYSEPPPRAPWQGG